MEGPDPRGGGRTRAGVGVCLLRRWGHVSTRRPRAAPSPTDIPPPPQPTPRHGELTPTSNLPCTLTVLFPKGTTSTPSAPPTALLRYPSVRTHNPRSTEPLESSASEGVRRLGSTRRDRSRVRGRGTKRVTRHSPVGPYGFRRETLGWRPYRVDGPGQRSTGRSEPRLTGRVLKVPWERRVTRRRPSECRGRPSCRG